MKILFPLSLRVMKFILPLLFLFTQAGFGQVLTEKEIDHYIVSVDSLRTANKLVKVDHPNKHFCGGIDGYFLNGKLVLLVATNQAELGFIRRTFYLKEEVFVKIYLQEHLAEWGKYEEVYPHDKFEWDPQKMTYSDMERRISLSSPFVFTKKSNNEFVKTEVDSSLLFDLLHCGHSAWKFLQEVTNLVDSLKFITQMPYICEMGPCCDPLYLEAIRLRKGGIELLIDHLDDTSLSGAIVPLFGYTHTTADIAYIALSEIIHGIPTFKLLGVPFDENGCGYCAYWQHLNKDYKNRQNFKQEVWHWYHKNKEQLVWIESNAFESCDCAIEHPNGGHYELQQIKDEGK